METTITLFKYNQQLIDTSEYYEIEIWAAKLGVSPEQLKSAVKAVGNSVLAIEKYLKK